MSHAPLISRLNKPALICVLSALTFPWLAHAATPVDEHRAATPQGAVEIDNVAGMIDVQGWDKSEVTVTGTIGKDVERVEVTGEGNRTSIRVILPEGHHWGMRDGEAHLVIHVPANSSITAALVSSDLKVSAVHGALELRTVSGNISGEGGGDVRANAVSGDIHLTALAAKMIEVKSISGNIVLTGGNAEVEATTVSGDVHVTLGTVSRARFKTVSGELSAALSAGVNAQIEGESVSGDVKLDFASAPAADFDIQTISGDIDNCFGPKPTESRRGAGARLSFKTGDSSARVRVSSHSGDVRLCAKK
jgi:Putative adhesin